MTDKKIGETPGEPEAPQSGTPPMINSAGRHSTRRPLAHHALHDLGGVPHLEHVGGVDEGVGLYPELAARREEAVDVLHLAAETRKQSPPPREMSLCFQSCGSEGCMDVVSAVPPD